MPVGQPKGLELESSDDWEELNATGARTLNKAMNLRWLSLCPSYYVA